MDAPGLCLGDYGAQALGVSGEIADFDGNGRYADVDESHGSWVILWFGFYVRIGPIGRMGPIGPKVCLRAIGAYDLA
ncbi:MAG: hypothetical protein AMXMBFR82_22460 [Candidatus Hydrogenedentota bacterium]